MGSAFAYWGAVPFTTIAIGMSSPDDHRFLDQMIEQRHPNEYALAMLERRGVKWAIEALHKRLRTEP